ncbi:MAG: L,D-transpeptidase [Candidatus Aminicenantes bacterium]|nr:L,D-transpeptidase [Candidatus Aminicenantes bacterium]
MRILLLIPFFVSSLWFMGCSGSPVPPEIQKAEVQNAALWRAGSPIHAAPEYSKYKADLREANFKFLKEKSKFVWFRRYRPIADEFKKILKTGEQIGEKIRKLKEDNTNYFVTQQANLAKRLKALKDVTFKINEGRLARGELMRAELMLEDAKRDYKAESYKTAGKKLDEADLHLRNSVRILDNVLKRYKDNSQINRWSRWIAETLYESRKNGRTAFIVNKIQRELIVYKNGSLIKKFSVGLGRNGLNDKAHAGDNATPEGRYNIIKKLHSSKYYKALLLNYPNNEDKRQFELAKKRGLIPRRVSIGNWIEIHGGGKDYVTRGCVSLENLDMEEIFALAADGDPVTIVGSMGYPHEIFSAITGASEFLNAKR